MMVSADRMRDVVEPTADDVLSCARAAVCRVMEVDSDTVSAASRLVEDLGADSLAIVEIAELMEDEMATRFRVRASVDGAVLMRTRTVGQLAGNLWRAFGRRGTVRPLVASPPTGAPRTETEER